MRILAEEMRLVNSKRMAATAERIPQNLSVETDLVSNETIDITQSLVNSAGRCRHPEGPSAQCTLTIA
jgi:hypothetical protein